ncbi:PRD domain-containing protein [uncultured Megamonas sp.]|uniref:BglG family transcription antiterminator n=1 Tax=uncultured Megamonas sp. TaxID=286140 RepID=UPI00266FC14A|nr:PRD domain-containing protein [uncultured Megamonas sp.]
MKNLQYRQKKLLQYLIELNDFRPVRYFAKKISCSDKTIRNDLKYFEEQNIKIEKISGKGIRLSNENKNIVNNLLEEVPRKLELTTEQRRMKILYDLLDGNKLSIQSLSDNYFVSKTSIVNDFKVIEEKLNQYNLKLKKDISGTKLIGEETDIRKALVDILNKMINYNSSIKKVYSRIDNATLEELEEHFGNENIKKIEKIIEKIEVFLNYKITEPYYINLVTHILILINRIKRDKTIYFELDLKNKSYNGNFYEASLRMAKDIEETFEVKLNNAEVFYLYRYLTSSGGLKENKDFEIIEDEYVKKIADEIIESCLCIFPIKFHFNNELYRALLLHLRPMLNRIKYKIFIKNPILDEVKLEFPELMILLKLVMSKIELKYNLSEISEDEIAYLTVYFQSAIEEVINRKSVIIVCSSGIGTSHLLEKRIKNYFPEWNIVDVVSAKQLELVLSLKKVDLVISTVHLQINIDKPIAYVSALFNKTDERRIRESFIKTIPVQNDVKKLNTINLLNKEKLNDLIRNSIFFKSIQIESIININFYKSNKLETDIFLRNDIESNNYTIDVFVKEKNLSNEKILILYNWILNNI